ncbi:hypothetical protein V8E36_006882 [Tilletia maclaganii]
MPLVPIHTLIVEREIEHLCALQEAICQHTSALLRIADALAELDCLVALADAAAKFGWVRPEMEIYQGRHALQELTVDSFVPTDAYPQGAAARPLQMRCCMRIKTGHERWTKPAGHHRSEMSWQQHLREASGTLLLLTSIQAEHSVSGCRAPSFWMSPRLASLCDSARRGRSSCSTRSAKGQTPQTALLCSLLRFGTFWNGRMDARRRLWLLISTIAHMEITFSGSGSDTDSVPTSDEELICLFRLAPGLALTSSAVHLARIFLVPEAIIERAAQLAEPVRTHNLTPLAAQGAESCRDRAADLCCDGRHTVQRK